MKKQINALLARLVAKLNIFNIGKVIKQAIILGVTKYINGLACKKYNASTCPVTFIVANSAVKDEHTRPITSTQVNTGQSSRKNANVNTAPIKLVLSKYNNSFTICKLNTKPINNAAISTILTEPGPVNLICSKIFIYSFF